MSDLLSGLALDRWYKVVLWIGAALLIVSVTSDVKLLTNKDISILAAGLICIGLGEWNCEGRQTVFKPPNIHTGPAATITYRTREWNVFGHIMLAIGLICVLRVFFQIAFG